MGIVAQLGRMGTDAINVEQQAEIAGEALDSQRMRDRFAHEQRQQQLAAQLGVERVLARYCTAHPGDTAACVQTTPVLPPGTEETGWSAGGIAAAALAVGVLGAGGAIALRRVVRRRRTR